MKTLLNRDNTLNEAAFDNFCKTNQQIALALHPNNGGKWLIDLFKEEVKNNTITIDQLTGEIEYRGESKVYNVREYIEDLPYLIYADNTINGHADIPLSDEELLHKIRTGDLTLTPEQMEYAVWSRQGDGSTPFVDKGRNMNSILAFVGHNIVQAYEEHYTPSVRYDTNTINLDVAAYLYGILFVVDVNNQNELARFG